MASKIVRCWDTDACLGYLSNQAGRRAACERVLTNASEGHCDIAISTLAQAEVLYLRGDGYAKLFVETRDAVRKFFHRDCFVSYDVTRAIAEHAQELFWQYNGPNGLMPKDAVHLATALASKAKYLETYDGNLVGLSGKVGGDLVIQHPGADLANPLTGGVEPDGQGIFGGS